MLVQERPAKETSSPTSVQSNVLMTEFGGEQSSEPKAEKQFTALTVYRRSSSEGNNASGPLFYDHDEKDMKMPPDRLVQVSSAQLPPRCTTAADAEKEKIFCLKRECKALKMAMHALPKHSKEWTMMNAKLEIAKDELQATLEDIDMTQNYSHKSIDSDDENKGSFVPTPPLSSPFPSTPVKTLNRLVSTGSDTDSSMEINELFANLKTPSLGSGGKPKKVDPEALKRELDKAEKYSLEYFKIKKKLDRVYGRSSSLSPSSASSGEGSVGSLQPPGSLKSFDESSEARNSDGDLSTPPSPQRFDSPEKITSPPHSQQEITTDREKNSAATIRSQQQSIKLGNGLGNLVELLDVVPKYSLEWFNLKKDIQSASGGQTPAVPTRKLSKHRSSLSVNRRNSVQPTQLNRLDSAEDKYLIPHVIDSNTRDFARKRRTSSRDRSLSRERAKTNGSQTFDSLDAQYFYVRMRRNVITVQRFWRGKTQRLNFINFRVAVISVQSLFRMSVRRNLYRQVIHKVVLIQRSWRSHFERIKLLNVPLHEIIVQSPESNIKPADHPKDLTATSSEDEDFSRIQQSIEAMKNEKMSMEMKLLQLKNDIDAIKNEKLRQDLHRMKTDIETLEHVDDDALFDNAPMSSMGSVYSHDQTLDTISTNVFSIVLGQKGSLGIEMEHHKSSDSVRITYVKKRSQADKAGLLRGDIVVNFRSEMQPDGMPYAQFIALARQGVRPLVLDITRVDPSVVGSSRRSGFFRKRKHK